jgi:hypothetical protein
MSKMNIFILSLDPKEAAEQHCDKHVIKMILETTQLLYICWESLGYETWRDDMEKQLCESDIIKDMKSKGQKVNTKTYKAGKGHLNHPCSKWLRESKENYNWLCSLGIALCEEKLRRWPANRQHACYGHLKMLQENVPTGSFPRTGLTPFAKAMPEEYKKECPVESYKLYYNQGKKHILKWTNRQTPKWINER